MKISQNLLSVATASLEDDKAVDEIVIDLSGKSALADFIVIASGRSQRQVGAMADHLVQKLKAAGAKGVLTEGQPQCDWVLVDAGDIVIHLFRPEVREFYKLEKLWAPNPAEDASQAVQAV
jgi:ribosome-associated protein